MQVHMKLIIRENNNSPQSYRRWHSYQQGKGDKIQSTKYIGCHSVTTNKHKMSSLIGWTSILQDEDNNQFNLAFNEKTHDIS